MKKTKILIALLTTVSVGVFTDNANAFRRNVRINNHISNIVKSHHHYKIYYRKHRHSHIIQCVAYVHSASDFKIHGDAKYWWSMAAGLYERGFVPEKNAVLAFKPVRRMRLGHVAIVNRVVDNRTITINQAHWGENKIVHDVKVIDVSQKNNWSAVRVELTHNKGNYGNIYPTYGFIYHRPVGSLKQNNDMISIDTNTQLSELPSDIQDEKPPSSLM